MPPPRGGAKLTRVCPLDGIYYISKQNNFLGPWIKARLQQVIAARSSHKGVFYAKPHYRLIELKQQRERILEGKFVGE